MHSLLKNVIILLMRAKEKKQKLAHFTDIQKKKEVEVIDLRKRTKIVNWLLIFVALILGGWLFYGAVIKADVSYFYPNSVLGTWQNIDKATGQPDLDWGADASEFNENNSAVFEGGGIKQLFFGNFQGQMNDYENKEIVRATLKINWVIDDKSKRAVQPTPSDLIIIEPSPTLLPTPSLENSSTTETPLPEGTILETSSPTESISPTSESTPFPTSESTSQPTSSPTPESTPSQIPSPTPESTPLTFLQFLIKKVFAQESTETPNPIPTPSETPTPTPTEQISSSPIPTEEISPSLTPTPTPSETISPTQTSLESPSLAPQETITETPNQNPSQNPSETPNASSTENSIATSTPAETSFSPTPNPAPLFEIRYSFDNKNWQTLAQISYDNFQNEFEIPLKNWEDIANLQVVIESTLNTNLDENLIAFVDGAQLEVEYQEMPQVTESVSPQITVAPNLELSDFLKQLLAPILSKTKKEVKVQSNQNIQTQQNCSVEPFNIEIKPNESKTAVIKLKKNTQLEGEKLMIGNLPQGIYIFFAKNNDYETDVSPDEKELTLTIAAVPNAQTGSFSIPIIYQNGNSTTICQINIINF
jgi:hypothetical protein